MRRFLLVRFQPVSYQLKRYFVLTQNVLSYEECDRNGRPLDRVDIPVSSINAVRLGGASHARLDTRASAIDVITAHNGTLQLRPELATDWGAWAQALCSVVPSRCVDPALRDRFQLPDVDHVDVSLLLLADDTVGDAVDTIVHAYHSRLNAPLRTDCDMSNYVLCMTDNDVSLANRQRLLCTYEHVRYCMASLQPLRVTVTLATDYVLARDETFVDPYDASIYTSCQ
ncbi:hypothetical protein SDRG_13560 [Saprolegnia diclina VS20]|uniref:PI3K-RBD domain-containing protein n=1 Tax=Saprolegnia diclina (strain VS20) TaxID=1156394 RepID=T0Q5H7_SAPDV|nr:hypothetical protein SDRG_13560 [Saprolegnia diclina VS20]EQC28685.1 hypothetical protein SDRG_13560 [Saprolegnia diclina VS20]|eukprot:XP_008617877.1 hypothetical protein SDRG_13560 [Saprolegnia diclina VS20]